MWSAWFVKIRGTNSDRAERAWIYQLRLVMPFCGPRYLDMPRLLGVDIPGEKRIEASLPYIYGIGHKTAKKILEQANIDPNARAKSLTPEQLGEIVHAINASGLLIEGDLRRDIQGNLKRLQAIRCYRGIRHIRGLPVRGQRTSTNARTRKGPRKTVGVQRNKDAKAGKV
jgi:small subunit ribosomal protein S13